MFTIDEWMSDFLKMPFISVDFRESIPENLLDYIPESFSGICQVRISGTLIDDSHRLTDAGFCLVDGKLEFITELSRPEVEAVPAEGVFRLCTEDDWDDILRLTRIGFSQNKNFKGRFNNRRYFSEAVSEGYYMEWNKRAFKTSPELFGVWEVGSVQAFYNINRLVEGNDVIYKVGLASVIPKSPVKGIQNLLQDWIYWQGPDETFKVINSPALSNTPGMINNVRAGRSLKYSELVFFRGFGTTFPVKAK